MFITNFFLYLCITKTIITMGQYYKPVILSEENEVLGWLYSHDFDNGLKLMEHSYVGNKFVSAFESTLTEGGAYHKSRVVWSGDYSDNNFYSQCQGVPQLEPRPNYDTNDYPFIVNHTKKQYVDKRSMIVFYEDADNSWQIHPLPLLTCEGNGQGGGDYHPNMYTRKDGIECNIPNDGKLVGSWAGDVISVESSIEEYKDFKEIKPKFREDW